MAKPRVYSDDERKERHKVSKTKYRASGKQRETAREYVRRCREADPTWQAKQTRATIASTLKRKYGLTFETREALLTAQGGLCKLCGKAISFGTAGGAHTDHCHDTGKVRGVLCQKCNTALGTLGDTVESLERAVRYLKGEK